MPALPWAQHVEAGQEASSPTLGAPCEATALARRPGDGTVNGSSNRDDGAPGRALGTTGAPAHTELGRASRWEEVASLSYEDGSTYHGGVLDGRYRHGTGTLTSVSGEVYVGEFRNDVREGRGVLTSEYGLVLYDGEWKADLPEGTGTANYPESQGSGQYVGMWTRGKRRGWGRFTFQDGALFEGVWMEDRPIDGELTFSCNNLVFLGTMNRDTGRPEKGTLTNKREEWEYSGTLNGSMEFDGAGRMRHPDYVYEGGWRAGLQDGEGKMTRRDGGEYQGEWRRGVFHGQGTLTALTCPAWGGIDFEGPFEEGVPNGVGQLRLGDGTRYSGGVRGGVMHGRGRCVGGGEKYVGEFRGGERHGEGECWYEDGGVYTGTWDRGLRHGQGTMIFADGTTFTGTWLEGKWVQSSADGWKSGIEGLPDAVDAGERVHFSIVARDDQGNQRLSGGDKYRVVVQLGEGEDVDSAQSFDAEDDANGRYSLDFVCQKAGRHDVHVFLVANDAEDGAEVHEALAGSPFMLSVQPSAPDPSSCRVSLRGDGSPIATGDCVQVDVLVRDRFGNDCAAVDALHFARKLTWRLLDSSGKDVMPQIDFDGTAAPTNALQNAEGDIRVVKSCRPPGPGMYRMHVAVEGGGELRGSPLSVQVHGDNLADAAGASSQPPPVDVAALWARIAAVELAGETESRDSSDERETAEEAYIRQHPDVPVVADLQDMWLVSRYQAERKRAERLASDRGGQGL